MKREFSNMVGHFDYSDRKINRTPSYNGQIHTSYGERGKAEIKGIKFSDLYQAISVAIKQSCMNEEEFDKIPIDVEAVAQNLNCNIEKLMGIFPNIPKLHQE